MNQKYHLTKKEEEVMELFWKLKKPLTSVEILAIGEEHSWKDNYLQVLLKSLLKKEFLRICGVVQYRNQYARQFEPALTKEEYVAAAMAEKGVEKTDLVKIMVAMAQEDENVDREKLIEQLEEMVKELRSL